MELLSIILGSISLLLGLSNLVIIIIIFVLQRKYKKKDVNNVKIESHENSIHKILGKLEVFERHIDLTNQNNDKINNISRNVDLSKITINSNKNEMKSLNIVVEGIKGSVDDIKDKFNNLHENINNIQSINNEQYRNVKNEIINNKSELLQVVNEFISDSSTEINDIENNLSKAIGIISNNKSKINEVNQDLKILIKYGHFHPSGFVGEPLPEFLDDNYPLINDRNK